MTNRNTIKKIFIATLSLIVFLSITDTSLAQSQSIVWAFVKGFFVGEETSMVTLLVKGLLWVAWYIFAGIGFVLEQILFFIGYLLEIILKYTVLEYRTLFYDAFGNGETNLIYQLWGFIRDILNSGVFFMMMYYAVKSMFSGFKEIQNKFQALILFAVFVNFSLLFVKAIIDVSNITTLYIYKAAIPAASNETIATIETAIKGNALLDNNTEPQTFTGYMIKHLNPANRYKTSSGKTIVGALSTLNNSDPTKTISAQQSDTINDTVIYQIAYILILLYLIYFFILIGSTFLIRGAVFIVAMIASPIIMSGFFGDGLGKYANHVKSSLIEYSLRGPLYMFITLLLATLASKIMTTPIIEDNSGPVNNLLYNELTMLLRFLIFGALFWFAKIMIDNLIDSLVTKKGKGKVIWGDKTSKLANYGLQKSLRGLSYLGKLTGGNVGRYMTEGAIGRGVQNMAASNNFITRQIGKGIGGLGLKMAGGTWDLANSKTATSAVNTLNKGTGPKIELGKGSQTTAQNLSQKVLEALGDKRTKKITKRAEFVGKLGKPYRKVDPRDIDLEKERVNLATKAIKTRSERDKKEKEFNTAQSTPATKISSSQIGALGSLSNEDMAKLTKAVTDGTAITIKGTLFDSNQAKTAKTYVDMDKLQQQAKEEVKEIKNIKDKRKEIKDFESKNDTQSAEAAELALKEKLANMKNDAEKKRQQNVNDKVVREAAKRGSIIQEPVAAVKIIPFDRKLNPGEAFRDARKVSREKVQGAAKQEIQSSVAHAARSENMQKYHISSTTRKIPKFSNVFSPLQGVKLTLYKEIEDKCKNEIYNINQIQNEIVNLTKNPNGYKLFPKVHEKLANEMEKLLIKQDIVFSEHYSDIQKAGYDPLLLEKSLSENYKDWNEILRSYSNAFPEAEKK